MFKRTKKQQPQVNANEPVPQAQVEIDSVQFSPNEQELRTIFKESEDVFFNSGMYRPGSPLEITLIGCQGMVDLDLLNHLVFERLHLFFEKYPSGHITKKDISTVSTLTTINRNKNEGNDVCRYLLWESINPF